MHTSRAQVDCSERGQARRATPSDTGVPFVWCGALPPARGEGGCQSAGGRASQFCRCSALVRDVGRGPRTPHIKQGVGVWYLGTASAALRLSADATPFSGVCLRAFGCWAAQTHRTVFVVPLARQARHEEGRADQDHAETPARTGFVAALWHYVPLASNRATRADWKREYNLSVPGASTSPVPSGDGATWLEGAEA